MKKLTCLWIVLALMVICVPALAEEPAWRYDTSNLYLKLAGEISGDVVIPSEVDGYAVSAIQYSAFQNQHGVASLTMPETLRALQSYAVSYMDALTGVTLNNGIEVIGNMNFSNLKALTNLTIPASVRVVDGAMNYCDALKEVRFEGVCPIFINPDWCFYRLPNDCVIYVPDDQMDAYALALENVNGAAQRLKPSGKNAVVSEPNDTQSWFKFDASTGTIMGYTEYHAFVEIPDTIGGVPVKAVAANAFLNDYSVYGVVFPEGLEHIDEGAFKHSSNIMYAQFPSTLKKIGDDAFFNAQMSAVDWSEGLTEIGARAFQYHRLTTVDLPSTVQFIGESAFEGGSLKELYLGGGVKSIASRAFASNDLSYMAFNVYAPIEIAGDAFAENNIADLDLPWDSSPENRDAYAALLLAQCPNCTVWINNPISGGVAEYPVNQTEITTFENGVWVSYNGDTADLTVWTTYDEMNVTALGDGVFKGNQSIRSFYPHHCGWFTAIGKEAFAKSSVAFVEMFGSITTIGEGAFRDCVNMTELTLPASLTEIGADAFEGCTGLTKLTVLCDPAILPEGVFNGCTSLTEVYAASDATVEQVRALGRLANLPWYLSAARAGEAMPSIQAMPYEPLPGDDFWFDSEYARLDRYNGYEVNLILPREIDGTELTMIGGGMMSRASCGDNYEAELPVRSVVIPETYTELTSLGFQNCETLETVVFYAPIETLPAGFFSGCTNLRNVIFVNGVRNVSMSVFEKCPNLQTIYLGECVENVDYFAFADADNGEVFSLDRCITSADQMPDVDALLTAAKGEAIPSPEQTEAPVPIVAAPIGAEGEAFFGTWYGVSLEMEGETFSLAEFGMDMRITLNADGTAELFDGEETDAAVWALDGDAAVMDGIRLTFAESGELCMEEDGSKLYFAREAAAFTPVAIGAEGEAFFGTWYGTAIEMDGALYGMSEFGMRMDITLNAEGTAEIDDGDEVKNLTWTYMDGAAAVSGSPLYLTEDGSLCLEDGESKILFSREPASTQPPVEGENPPAELTTPAPETPAEPKTPDAAFDMNERFERKYVIVSADVQGMSMTPQMLGGYEYSLIFHENGTVDFTMAGAAVPGLTWTQGKVVIDDVEKDALSIDYYGTPLNVVITEEGFDMNYFDSMTIHFAVEE